jgi:protein-L-isoaspartate(D-aspartate) O-methyltransferase
MADAIPTEPFEHLRQDMVENQIRARGIEDERTLAAMSRVPRHEFVDERYRKQAYADHPIPIGENQTISQPYIVALTVAALKLHSSDLVLEIGAGSGYQTAILAELSKWVYSVERHASLAMEARTILARLGYRNVTIIIGDGSEGLSTHAPYNAIAVAAAAPELPKPLLDQLNEAGRMVVPIGPADAQRLELIEKHDGHLLRKVLEGCRFVPLIGSHGYAPAPEK